MAKKHKNLDNIPIQWDGDLSKPSDGSTQSSPDNIDLGTWGPTTRGWNDDGTYTTVFERSGCLVGGTWNIPNCQVGVMDSPYYFEDFDVSFNGMVDGFDAVKWRDLGGRPDLYDIVYNYAFYQIFPIKASESTKPSQPSTNYTWGDVSFVIEIADGLGTGSRRAREARLHKFDKDTKKRLIHLICRVKGEKVYDEEKVVGDIQIKLEDADLVIERVLGKMRVENANVL